MPGHRKLWGFSERGLRQLRHQMRVKEERIAELETENAILHLKLAEYQERMNRSSREAWPYALLRTRQCQQGSIHAAFLQLGYLTRVEVTSALPKSPFTRGMLSGVGLRRAPLPLPCPKRLTQGTQTGSAFQRSVTESPKHLLASEQK